MGALFIDKNIIREAFFILKTNSTIRKTAVEFNKSKTQIHKDVSYKLKKINYDLYLKIKDIMNNHLKERHIKGGQATKNKYLLGK